MSNDDIHSERSGPLEKLLEIIGVKNPGDALKKVLETFNVKSLNVNEGSFDIQAIYTELEKAVMDAGLGSISRTMAGILKDSASRIKMEDIKAGIQKLKVKENIALLDKFAEIANVYTQYRVIKDGFEKLGVKNAGSKLKQIVEESVLQERIENLEDSLTDIGVAKPREKIIELLEAMGLKGAYNELKDLLGWNDTALV